MAVLIAPREPQAGPPHARPAAAITLGTGTGVIYACTVRFLAISTGGVEVGPSRAPALFN